MKGNRPALAGEQDSSMNILLAAAMILSGLILFGLFYASIGYFDRQLKG